MSDIRDLLTQNERAIVEDHQRVLDENAELRARLAKAEAERRDWARLFKLDGITPARWMKRALKAEAERDELRAMLAWIAKWLTSVQLVSPSNGGSREVFCLKYLDNDGVEHAVTASAFIEAIRKAMEND